MSNPFSRYRRRQAQGRSFRLAARALENRRGCAYGTAYSGKAAS